MSKDTNKTLVELMDKLNSFFQTRNINYSIDKVLAGRSTVKFKIGSLNIDLRIIIFRDDHVRLIFNNLYSTITGEYYIWDSTYDDKSLTNFINETFNTLNGLEAKLTEAIEILGLAKTAFDELGVDISGLMVGELLGD